VTVSIQPRLPANDSQGHPSEESPRLSGELITKEGKRFTHKIPIVIGKPLEHCGKPLHFRAMFKYQNLRKNHVITWSYGYKAKPGTENAETIVCIDVSTRCLIF